MFMVWDTYVLIDSNNISGLMAKIEKEIKKKGILAVFQP